MIQIPPFFLESQRMKRNCVHVLNDFRCYSGHLGVVGEFARVLKGSKVLSYSVESLNNKKERQINQN